jgi:cephalosporin hydroxylase
MVVGEASAEKLIAADFVKPIYNGNHLDQPVGCGFFGEAGEHLFSIPTRTVKEAVELSNRFQDLFVAAIRKASVGVGSEQKIIDDFHRLLYGKTELVGETLVSSTEGFYLGRQIQKTPMDLMVYQEILYEMRPELVVELGTATGASAHYLANLMDHIGVGKVLTVDIHDCRTVWPAHQRIQYLVGDTGKDDVFQAVKSVADKYKSVMVILDDDHMERHVLEELMTYGWLTTVGQYLVVEDTNVNGHPVLTGFGGGPREALARFLGEWPGESFLVDRKREKYLVTNNPGGWLRRIK